MLKIIKRNVWAVFLTAFFLLLETNVLMANPEPVKIVSFVAKYIPENRTVNLHWVTEGERDNVQYIIERSLDSLNFMMIGETKSNGNAKSRQHYYFSDSHLMGGISFYRIREVVDSGSQFVTPAVKVNAPIAGMELAQLLLSDDQKELNFAIISPDSAMSKVLISDLEGHIQSSYPLDLKRGANTHSIYTGNLIPGIYFFQLNTPDDGNTITKEFTIGKQLRK